MATLLIPSLFGGESAGIGGGLVSSVVNSALNGRNRLSADLSHTVTRE
jgi:hypothetical protein